MTSLQPSSSGALNFTSSKMLKKYLESPDNTEKFSKSSKISPYEGGFLISSSINRISPKAARSLENITIASESLKEALNENCAGILNSGRIKILRRTGYCGGAERLFINEYFLAKKRNERVDLSAIGRKFENGVPLKGCLRQIFSEVATSEDDYGSTYIFKEKILEKGQYIYEDDFITKSYVIKSLLEGVYSLELLAKGHKTTHGAVLIKERTRAYIFDVNYGLIKFEDSQNSSHQIGVYFYLKNASLRMFPAKNGNLECEFTFKLKLGPERSREIQERCEEQRIIVTSEEIQISPNITKKIVVPLTKFNKYKMFAKEYAFELILMSGCSLVSESISAIPYFSLSRRVLNPLLCGLSNTFGDETPYLQYNRRLICLGNKNVSNQQQISMFVSGVAISLAAEIFFSPPTFLAKVGIACAATTTSLAVGVIADRIGLIARASVGLIYTKEKITFVAKKTFSVMGVVVTKTKKISTNVSSTAKNVMSATANFFRSFCYSH